MIFPSISVHPFVFSESCNLVRCTGLPKSLRIKRVLIRIRGLCNAFISLITFLDYYGKRLIAIKFLDELTWYQVVGLLIIQSLTLSSLYILISK